ncbi:MAG: argininosuccinate synthase, partial [Pseudomonadota bacterium]
MGRMKKIKKVVLAYSGGLDTSVILRWLIETYHCDVVAYTANLGQTEELSGLEDKALKTGACKVYVEDLQEEFVRDYIFPMLKANAVYEGGYLLGTSIARPLIAKKQIETAKKEGADAVSHGATGKGNDQVRFELTYLALNPKIKIVAPWREWNLDSRTSLIEYAKKHKIPVSVTEEKPYSSDRNLFHVSFEGGILEDPWTEPDEGMYVLSVSPERAPDKPTYVEIDFEQGIPRAVNGKKKGPAHLLKYLNDLGGQNGIGRVDLVENRYVGMKSRGVYETPGGTVLYEAHRALETLTLERDTLHYKQEVSLRYAELVYYGKWYSPLREALDAFVESTQRHVTGTVRLKLYKGNCNAVGIKSP